MQKYFNSVTNSRGDAILGARVAVTLANGLPATIYSDNGVTVQANPMITDGNGFFAFYAAAGRYTLRISGVGIPPVIIADILLEDELSDFPSREELSAPSGGDESGVDFTPNYTLLTLGGAVRDIALNVRMFPWLAKGDGSTDDRAAIQAAATAAGPGGRLIFPKTATNVYAVSGALKFYGGQQWSGCGGVDIVGLGTEIRLTATSSSVAEPFTPSTTTYGFSARGVYFNAQGFGDVGLSLYNTSYADIDQCAANCAKAGGAAILLDSNVSLQCYFNTIKQPRVFSSGIGSVGMRFTRGANANQVIGGKCTGVRGMEFLSLSSGNAILCTDFEESSDRHIYVDAANNVFMGLHMESAPVGYDLTVNATNTQRMNTTFATTCVINVQDASKIGTVLDTRSETSATKGDLRFGPARFLSTYLSGGSTLDYDPDLVSGSSNALIRLFLNTTTSGQRKLTLYKGDGTSTITAEMDAATGAVYAGDITQENPGTGIARKTLRRAAPPSTAAAAGDTILRTNPSATAPVVQQTCLTSGTPGAYQATAWAVFRGTTAQRPALTAIDIGVQYLDNTLAAGGKPIWWNGAAWVDALGVVV